ncbi:hypothetical protein K432DRAFT_426787 [Lepidopterella palustris CBS 459.81]|uniref:BZIP domain-containing protein n=1 Tax=Lepidopterella palustris CBS 459.81 TaxID=1314670 RepID=A0A8E2E8B2_9PEZI|nr:hypothetical protein K432DRAFT_426787 [Lepidopterella palustris CBS 459.81]
MNTPESKSGNVPAPTALDGTAFGYGHWFEPIESGFGIATGQDIDNRASAEGETEAERGGIVQPRGRGRPRVIRQKDDNAIEKRRAQIRNAQRSYRERKENAAAHVSERCDDLLQVISDISTELEELLRISSAMGALDREDELGRQLRRTASCYDSAILRPCLSPELRLLQVKSRRRQEMSSRILVHSEDSSSAPTPQEDSHTSSSTQEPPVSARAINMDLGRVGESTLINSFLPYPAQFSTPFCSILDTIKDRQARLNCNAVSDPLVESFPKHPKNG